MPRGQGELVKKQKRPHRAVRRKVTEADRRARDARAVERAIERQAEDEAQELAVDRARAAHTPAEIAAEMTRLEATAGDPTLSNAEQDAADRRYSALWRQWEPTAEQIAEQRALIEQEAAEAGKEEAREVESEHQAGA
jgi:hypothetical protein